MFENLIVAQLVKFVDFNGTEGVFPLSKSTPLDSTLWLINPAYTSFS